MKTNRLAYKKLRVGGRGKVKHARARTSHNTAKKSAARMRQLRHMKVVDDTNMTAVRRMLPYMGSGH